jgi:hypothetical protein
MPRSPRTAGIILAVFIAWNTSALAQRTPTTTPRITPPVVESGTDVPYPEHGQATPWF